jgi:hypothetical protein
MTQNSWAEGKNYNMRVNSDLSRKHELLPLQRTLVSGSTKVSNLHFTQK